MSTYICPIYVHGSQVHTDRHSSMLGKDFVTRFNETEDEIIIIIVIITRNNTLKITINKNINNNNDNESKKEEKAWTLEREAAPVADLAHGQQEGSQDGHARERGRERQREGERGGEREFHAEEEEAGIAGIAGVPTSAGKEAVTPGAIAVEIVQVTNPLDKPSTSSWLNPFPKPRNPKL